MSAWTDLGLPLPNASGYSYLRDAALKRTQFASAMPDQDQRNINWRKTFELSWNLTLEQLPIAEQYLLQYGYSWFDIELLSNDTPVNEIISLHSARLISDYKVSALGGTYFRLNATLEGELVVQTCQNITCDTITNFNDPICSYIPETSNPALFAFRVPIERNNIAGSYRYFLLEPNENINVNATLIGQIDNWRLFEIEYLESVDGIVLYSIASESEDTFVSTLVDKSPIDNYVVGKSDWVWNNYFYKNYTFYGKNSENILSISDQSEDLDTYWACAFGYIRYEDGSLSLIEPDKAYWGGSDGNWLCGSRLDKKGFCITEDGDWCGEVTWMRTTIKNVVTENINETPIISPELGMYMDWRNSLEYQGPIYFGSNNTSAQVRCGQYEADGYIYGATAYAVTVSGVTLDQSAIMLEVFEASISGYSHKWYGYYNNIETDLTPLLDSINAYNMLWIDIDEEEEIWSGPHFISRGQYGVYNLCENFNYASTFMILQRAYAIT